MSVLEHWTDEEVRRVRRNLAYHQKCSLRAVSKDAARAFLDEQQRRRNELYSSGSRYFLNGGTLGPDLWKTLPLADYPPMPQAAP
jgi:hypothetical protein